MALQSNAHSAGRVVIAGLSGDSGKTVVSLALLLLARRGGIPTAAFKKGPDYIDAAWLSWASGNDARNLDTFLMGQAAAACSFSAHAVERGLNLVEGNRGLYDGADAAGTHSTAELAKLLSAPVMLVVNAAKVTRTAAACVLGCQKLDPTLQIAGVILNRVAGHRHESVLRESFERTCRLPVLGVIPRVAVEALMPGRHLGLVTPQEYGNLDQLFDQILALADGQLDFDRILKVAESAPSWHYPSSEPVPEVDGRGLRIAYVRDSAFTFYYPENLEALERSGAQLVPMSSLTLRNLPEKLDALYIGGGFPEIHASKLSSNVELLGSLRREAAAGLPIYAECGGLMLLSRAVHWKGKRFEMAGVLPCEAEVCDSPQGHGYVELVVDQPNPFYEVGLHIRGHEFHYSRLLPSSEGPATVCAVERGTGCCGGREAIVIGNVWASYTHVHATGVSQWAKGLIARARWFAENRNAHERARAA